MPTKITLRFDKSAERALLERAGRVQPRSRPMEMSPVEKAVHFLRGVRSRATLVLPAFYLFHGSHPAGDGKCSLAGYPGVVLRHALEFSSINSITLATRSIFDHDPSGLTGWSFAKSSKATLAAVAEYWSTRSGRPASEARTALDTLQIIFREYSRSTSTLFRAAGVLGPRIALLKQHGDRAAAHLSLENYEFSILDVAHVVGAHAVIGEIVRSFDAPEEGSSYFDAIDQASLDAARNLFPDLPDLRLFQKLCVSSHARGCWGLGPEMALQLVEGLPYAMEWY